MKLGNTLDVRPQSIEPSAPRVLEDVAEKLVFRKLGVLLVLALVGLVVLQSACLLVLWNQGPRNLYVPEARLLRPQLTEEDSHD